MKNIPLIDQELLLLLTRQMYNAVAFIILIFLENFPNDITISKSRMIFGLRNSSELTHVFLIFRCLAIGLDAL